MKQNRLHALVLLAACLCQAGMVSHVPAQTVVVEGTVATSATTVRNAAVSFTNTNGGTVFSTTTDSLGRYRLAVALTSVGGETPLPAAFALEQNYPNPFTSSTAISYSLTSQTDARVIIYDILGRVVREAAAGSQAAGAHNVVWDGTNARGQKVAPGVYFYSLQAGGKSQVRKMVMYGGSGGVLPSIPQIAAPAPPARPATAETAPAGMFTLRVENGGGTFPLIAAVQSDSVYLSADTTINLLVENLVPVPVVAVYADSLLQYIRGFGGANILPWRPAMSAGEMATAFGTGAGQLGFTILRLRVPSTSNVSEFNAQLQVALLARAQGALVFASPWSPPAEMKSNGSLIGGILNESSYAAFAAHLKSFADYMETNGAPLYAVSVQNEPDATVTYESCFWNALQFRTFMRDNAPAIGTRVMMPESQNFVRALSDSTLNDSTAAAHTAIIAGHIYGGGLGAYPLAVSRGKEVWMTEHLDLDTTWTGVLGTGREIHDCMTSGWNAYLWWYIVRYYGPISEDGTVSKRGYVMSHFSRFIRPGFHRIKCSATPQRSVYLTAYRDPATSAMVLVAINTGAGPIQQSFSLPGGTLTGFAAYTTSRTKNCAGGSEYDVVEGGFTATLEPSSITTFVSSQGF